MEQVYTFRASFETSCIISALAAIAEAPLSEAGLGSLSLGLCRLMIAPLPVSYIHCLPFTGLEKVPRLSCPCHNTIANGLLQVD